MGAKRRWSTVRAADGFEGWSVPAANRVRRSNVPELIKAANPRPYHGVGRSVAASPPIDAARVSSRR